MIKQYTKNDQLWQDNVTKENIKEVNPNLSINSSSSRQNTNNWRLSSRSGKTNALLSMTKQQNDDDCSIIDNIYLYVRDRNEAKYQYLIKNMNWS